MPVTPPGWVSGQIVAPTILNTSLYSFEGGSPFYPTGIGWHASRPVYLSVANASYVVEPGTWAFPFQGAGAANIICDTGATYGTPMDPPAWGAIQSNAPAADGTAADAGGGWFLIWQFTPIGNAADDGDVYEADISVTGENTTYGQAVLAPAGGAVVPWTLDLVNTEGNVYTPYVYNGSTAAAGTITSAEGDGTAVRLGAMWMATRYGSAAAAVPPAPKTNWAAGDEWTSAWANGPAGVTGVLDFLNYPPLMRAQGSTATAIANETATVIGLTGTWDPWDSFDSTTSTWTAPADGLYLVFGLVTFSHIGAIAQCSARVNGTDWYGPDNHTNSGQVGTAAKVQVFSLLAGDTVQLTGYQTSGASADTSTTQMPRLIIAWLGSQGTTGALPSNGYFSGGSAAGWEGYGGITAGVQVSPAYATGVPYPSALSFTPNGTEDQAFAEESGAPFTVTPGAWYAISAWVLCDGTASVYIGFGWADSGTYVSASTQTVTAAEGEWVFVHTMAQAPASGVNQGYCRVGRSASSAVPSSDAMLIAGVQAGQVGAGQPQPPSLGFRYAAGTPGDQVAGILTEHLGNDLSFLTWKPCLLAYQSTAQSVANNTVTQVKMNQVAGVVHGDHGDNYGGWNAGSGWYVAQVPGWYLVVAEVMVAADTSASWPMVGAHLQVSTSPGTGDQYEDHVVTSASDGTVPGAAAIGIYYLREGDYIFPQIATFNYATADTSVSSGHASHFECIWISE